MALKGEVNIRKSPPTDLFYQLDTKAILDAVESTGLKATGEYFALNSYENRVYEIFLEPSQKDIFLNIGNRVIAKFYRPQRWNQLALLDEHFFVQELFLAGLPVIAPLSLGGQTLHVAEGVWFTLFKKGMGRLPDELNLKDLEQVGRLLARLHNVGAQSRAQNRPSLTLDEMGWNDLDFLEDWIAPEVRSRYLDAAEEILSNLENRLDPEAFIRIHGDCHRGNLLKTDVRDAPSQFFLVDFDDFVNGPAAQDFWMLFSGGAEDSVRELEALLKGYEELRSFPQSQLPLFSVLRGLRIIRYGAWIARRWRDPVFPQLFPQFMDFNYWAEETEQLERIASST